MGAGAAGLWAAECAARAQRAAGREPDVLLLEKMPRAGTKVLASGGTRCNLTTTLGAEGAARLFGPAGERFLRRAFRELPPASVRERFAAWGVPTVEAGWEKVFPASGRARDVRDALQRACADAGVRLRVGAGVAAIERAGGEWCVRLASGEAVRAKNLLLAPGGKSYSRTGTTGDGYTWLAELGLELVPPVAALVPLASSEPWVHALSGVSVQDAEVRLRGPRGEDLGRRRRPVLFTHEGLSGPGPMDLSAEIARGELAGETTRFELRIDLLPEVPREDLVALFREAAGRGGAPRISSLVPAPLPKRLLTEVNRIAGLFPDPRTNELTRATRHALIETLKGLPVPISGTLGFDRAEVTSGGLALSELDPGTLRVKNCDGLFAFGEVIDLDGPIGGLNFQSAFATAELAAQSAATP